MHSPEELFNIIKGKSIECRMQQVYTYTDEELENSPVVTTGIDRLDTPQMQKVVRCNKTPNDLVELVADNVDFKITYDKEVIFLFDCVSDYIEILSAAASSMLIFDMDYGMSDAALDVVDDVGKMVNLLKHIGPRVKKIDNSRHFNNDIVNKLYNAYGSRSPILNKEDDSADIVINRATSSLEYLESAMHDASGGMGWQRN